MRKSHIRRHLSRPGLAMGALLLGLLSTTGIAFGSWSALHGVRVDGIQAEFASVLDARKYVEGHRFACTPYCEDGFLPKDEYDRLSSTGELTFSFDLVNIDGPLREVAGEEGLPVALNVSSSAEFLGAFPSAFDQVEAAIGNSVLPSDEVLVSSSGNERRISFRIALPADSTSLAVGLKLRLSAEGTGSSFHAAASALDPAEGTPLSVSIFLGENQ